MPPIVSALTAHSQLGLQTRGYPYEMKPPRDLLTSTERVAWTIQQMKNKGMSLEQLAAEVGCTHATLSQWQSGATKIENAKAYLLDEFCRVCEVSTRWILHGHSAQAEIYDSERVASLSHKLAVMEATNPYAFNVAEKMVEAASAMTPGPTDSEEG